MTVRFTRPCPTCGRRVDVPASLLGHGIACGHCGAEFIASAAIDSSAEGNEASDHLLDRVEEILRRADSMPTSDSNSARTSGVSSSPMPLR
ncbi:MAG: response regulator [Planctomycetota bacterium]